MNFLPILLLTLTTTTLVLRTGDRITVDNDAREENGVVTFRVKGVLYSLPAGEVDRIVRETEGEPIVVTPPREPEPPPTVRLPVSDDKKKRLIAELEQNHAGTPAPTSQLTVKAAPIPTEEQVAAKEDEEWRWRREAKSYEEAIRRAQEELDLLEQRAYDLRQRIFAFISLGYKPSSFTYDSTQLQRTLDKIPRAELELRRAERAYDDFREEARRRGILPGWLH